MGAILGGIQFEDVLLPKAVHLEEKANHQRRWSGVPEMVVYTQYGSQLIGQSNACLRYLGSITGLYPSSCALEGALVDEVMDSVENMITECLMPIMKSEETDRPRVIEQLMSGQRNHYGTLRMWFDRFEQRLNENENRGNDQGYFVGNTLPVADLKAFGHFRNYSNGVFEELYGFSRNILKENGYLRIAEFVRKIAENPRVSAFIAVYDQRLQRFEANPSDEAIRTCIYPGKLMLAKL